MDLIRIGTLHVSNGEPPNLDFLKCESAFLELLNGIPEHFPKMPASDDDGKAERTLMDLETLVDIGYSLEKYLPCIELGFCDNVDGTGIYPLQEKIFEGLLKSEIFPRIYRDKAVSFPISSSQNRRFRLSIKINEFIFFEDLQELYHDWILMSSDPAFNEVMDKMRDIDYFDGYL